MTLEAIPPSLLGSKIHLYQEGYQPGAKTRSAPDRNLCGQFTHRAQWDRRIPLAEAVELGWGREGFTPDTPEYVHVWKHWEWCRGCIGHAVFIAGMLDDTVASLAVDPTKVECQRPERCAGCTGRTCTKNERFARDHNLQSEA